MVANVDSGKTIRKASFFNLLVHQTVCVPDLSQQTYISISLVCLKLLKYVS